MTQDGPKLRPLDDDFGPLEPKPKVKEPRKRAPSATKRSIEQDIASLLVYANLMLAPVLKSDVMDDVEILALAKAIDDQAKKSPRFRAAIDRMLTAVGGTGLIGVAIIIIARRASRHGLMSPDWDQKLGIMLAVGQMTPAQQQAYMEEQMAAFMAAVEQEATNGEHPTPAEPGPSGTETPGPS